MCICCNLRGRPKKTSAGRGWGLVKYGHFSDKGRGVLQKWMSALFGAKNFEFFEIYGMSAQARGVDRANADNLRTGGEGVNFSRFCAKAFYGRP